jgi:hypothetical protein
MSKRCNGASDCGGGFDETNCQTVVIDKHLYRKEFPPNNEVEGKTEIKIDFTIFSIEGFNEIDMTFRIKFELSMQW